MTEANCRILYVKPVEKELRWLDATTRKRVVRNILALADNPRPRGVVKLSGIDNLYRIRQGAYRIIYEIRDGELIDLVVMVAHRRDVYRGL